MEIEKTDFEGLYILTPRLFEDERGYFFESYNESVFKELGIPQHFVQDNQSFSRRGTLRGLHFQRPPHAQSKLVRVLQGTILDVVVDLRKDLPTFGKHCKVELSSENKKQLFVPKGFAHGFVVLSTVAEVLYKCDEFYNKECEGGIIYNDPKLGIDWGLNSDQLTLSSKDLMLPEFKEG